MKKPDPNKQKELTAESLKRIAKALRIRAKNHDTSSKKDFKQADVYGCHINSMAALIYTGFSHELDAEATTLRAMR